jgi:hypothetical protein
VWCGSDADPGVCSASSDSRTERVRDSTCGACDADMVRGVAATPIHVCGSGTACMRGCTCGASDADSGVLQHQW